MWNGAGKGVSWDARVLDIINIHLYKFSVRLKRRNDAISSELDPMDAKERGGLYAWSMCHGDLQQSE